MINKIIELYNLRKQKNVPFVKNKKKKLSKEILAYMGDEWEKEVGDYIVVKQKHNNETFRGFCIAIYTKHSYKFYKKYNQGLFSHGENYV